MELSELISYAEEKYQIRAQRDQWVAIDASLLCHPRTKNKLAYLMREWNGDMGEFIERCDLRCEPNREEMRLNLFLSAPFHERRPGWVGVIIDSSTDKEVVLGLFDRAFQTEEQQSRLIEKGTSIIVIASENTLSKDAYHDTPIGASQKSKTYDVPEAIAQMLDLYTFDHGSYRQQCLNFYRQGKLMEMYEDNAPWHGEYRHYYPTYHDLNIPQLRGYFTWRTLIRRGEWQRTALSMAYIYIYELLNGIGVATPEASLEKMLEFEEKYIKKGLGDMYMGITLRRWMFEFAVINNMPPEKAMQCATQEIVKLDNALAALHSPASHCDRDVVNALCFISGQRKQVLDSVIHLVAETWRYALQHFRLDGKDLFAYCFGEKKEYIWRPLANAIYYEQGNDEDAEYKLNECRSFRRCKNVWFECGYHEFHFKRAFIGAFLHQADLHVRRYLKTGHYLREKKGEEWALQYVNAVIDEDKRRREEKARPKIEIHLENLEDIRENAIRTRDSLLVDEELEECPPDALVSVEKNVAPLQESEPQLPIEKRILYLMLNGESPEELMKGSRLMPSIVADSINEAFFDEIGDNVVECDNDRLTLVEDYADDVRKLMDM